RDPQHALVDEALAVRGELGEQLLLGVDLRVVARQLPVAVDERSEQRGSRREELPQLGLEGGAAVRLDPEGVELPRHRDVAVAELALHVLEAEALLEGRDLAPAHGLAVEVELDELAAAELPQLEPDRLGQAGLLDAAA